MREDRILLTIFLGAKAQRPSVMMKEALYAM